MTDGGGQVHRGIVRGDLELLRLYTLSGGYTESVELLSNIARRWVAGAVPELGSSDTAFLVEALFKCGRLGDATHVAARRASLGESVTGFDDLALQYHQLENFDLALPPRTTSSPVFGSEVHRNAPRIMSLYHSSITYQGSGYTVRTQALLENTELDILALTRVGYPWVANVAKASVAKGDKGKLETTNGKVKYRHRRGHLVRQTLTFSNIALSKHELLKAINELRPQAVHAASNFVNALPALLAARTAGLPFVYEMRGIWELTAGVGVASWLDSERYRLERRIETFVALNADRVIVLSDVQKRELIDRGVDAERIDVVANGHDPVHVDGGRAAALLTGHCPGLTEWIAGRTVIGYAGAIAVYEGLQDLIAVLGEHREALRDVVLVVAGDGPYLERLRAEVAELGLADGVRVLGRVPREVADALYSVIDLCILPRKPDLVSQLITPLKTVEILSHGKVLLASDVGAIAEQVRRYGFGELFVAGDRADLARQLKRVLAELPALKSRYAQATNHIAARFSWGAIAKEWDSVLAAALPASSTVKPGTTASHALVPLYDDRSEPVVQSLPLWRRVARARLTIQPTRSVLLRIPLETEGRFRLVAVPEGQEVGQDVTCGKPQPDATPGHVLRELESLKPGVYTAFLYLKMGWDSERNCSAFRLLSPSQFGDLVELASRLTRETRQVVACELNHDAKVATDLRVGSNLAGEMRAVVSCIPLTGAELKPNFVQRARSKVTGTRFHYVTLTGASCDLSLFPRLSGPVLVELALWGESRSMTERISQVSKVQHLAREASLYPVLDRSRTNVLVAANVNENLLDGSTIWLKTLVNTLASRPNVNVYVVTNAIHVSNGVTAELFDKPNVAKIDLWASGSERIHDIARRIHMLDRSSGGFDLIVVRGVDFAKVIVDKATRDRTVYYGVGMFRHEDGEVVTDETKLHVASKCSGVIFQNRLMERMFRERHPDFRGECYRIAPCVEDRALSAVAGARNAFDEKLVVYAGKLIREYGLLELIEAVRQYILQGHATRLVILGNKFDGRDPDYQREFETALAGLGDAVTWLPAVAPSTALYWVAQADAVWGWRHAVFENSHFEISTKMVEAISCGAPIVLYPAAANSELMGSDYVGFAESASDAAQALARLLSLGRDGFESLAARIKGQFKASNAYAPLLGRVDSLRGRPRWDSGARQGKVSSILVAGHDFRFFGNVESRLLGEGHAVTREYWKNHTTRHMYGQSAAADKADIIFCEWCLGNAVWWSNNLPPGKRLFIRLHLQELQTNHPAEVDFSRVEKVIFISPYVMREAVARFRIPQEKCVVVPISVRLDAVTAWTPEQLRRRRSVIGMVGLTPWRKRPDKALGLFRSLRTRYPDLTLHLKGHTPSDYAWMASRKDELASYQELFREIATLERQGIVQISGYDDQLEEFYRNTGWVLSLSDFEGCHTSVAEGGVMGCMPLITNWSGADEVYPPELVHSDLIDVERFFDAHYESFEQDSQEIQKRFQASFGITAVYDHWKKLLFEQPVKSKRTRRLDASL